MSNRKAYARSILHCTTYPPMIFQRWHIQRANTFERENPVLQRDTRATEKPMYCEASSAAKNSYPE
jgi:hypothetical protein